MGFLFPLFLLTGVLLAVPVLIHLFNLRRSKRVVFPSIRLLKKTQHISRRSSELKKKWLLASRLLLLAMLILAFAQPFFGKVGQAANSRYVLCYIDNSYSMSALNGTQTLLQEAIADVRRQIEAADEGTAFVLLTNDRLNDVMPIGRSEAIDALRQVNLSGQSRSMRQVLRSVVRAQENEPKSEWTVSWYSDFQKSTLLPDSAEITDDLLPETSFFMHRYTASNVENKFIDSIYFLDRNPGPEQPYLLAVHLRDVSPDEETPIQYQVFINGQMRSVKRVSRDRVSGGEVTIDTLQFIPEGGRWNAVSLVVADQTLPFDDTFRFSLPPARSHEILVVGNQSYNPYLRAALSSMHGFQASFVNLNQVPDDRKKYSLIIFQEAEGIPGAVVADVAQALEGGQSILIFPGESNSKSGLNHWLEPSTGIHFDDLDTLGARITTLYQNHPLLRGVFETIPKNVTLPDVDAYFPIKASLKANEQTVMEFANGRPFLARYGIGDGKLFLVATPLTPRFSDFVIGYFFAPLLYKMALPASNTNMFSLTVGSEQPLWLPTRNDRSGRAVWHLLAPGMDIVPPQRADGRGVNIYAGKTVNAPGFYRLRKDGADDSAIVAINIPAEESLLASASKKSIEQALRGFTTHWLAPGQIPDSGFRSDAGVDLWKVLVVLCLIFFLVESYFLLRDPDSKSMKSAPDI